MRIVVSFDKYDYIFRKEGNKILFNGEKLILNPENIEDPNEKNDSLDLYKEYVKEGYSKDQAKIKSALYFAPYIIVENSPVIELMDYIVLYMMNKLEGLPKLNNDLYIVVKNDMIYSRKKDVNSKIDKYCFPSTGSICISYDYKALLEALINDNI